MRNGHFNNRFDADLDAALARYAAVKPREGLEQRIVSNLRSQPQRRVRRGWVRPVGALAAAAVFLAALLAWHETSAPMTEIQVRIAGQGPAESARGEAALKSDTKNLNEDRNADRTERLTGVASKLGGRTGSKGLTVVAEQSAPKLEEFPAPEGLTPAERDLVRFIELDSGEAEMVALASADQSQRNRDEMEAVASETNTKTE